jgi:hypothetical protein
VFIGRFGVRPASNHSEQWHNDPLEEHGSFHQSDYDAIDDIWKSDLSGEQLDLGNCREGDYDQDHSPDETLEQDDRSRFPTSPGTRKQYAPQKEEQEYD